MRKRTAIVGTGFVIALAISVLIYAQQLSWRNSCVGHLEITWNIAGNDAQCFEKSTATITGIIWDDASTVSRMAQGSDRLPVTWGDDGDIYTAFGDGYGFEPLIPTKLSNGMAKVSGVPHTHTGTNIWPSSGCDQVGGGSTGRKANGIVMIDGVLYLAMSNADHAGRYTVFFESIDHGQSCIESSWYNTELGLMVFINFGQNYQGARDNHVYAVSHNYFHAYIAADDLVLGRVPKDEIMTEASWEWFKELDVNGNPVWSSNIMDRGSILNWPGSFLRVGITYNAPLQRYMMWAQDASGGQDTRFVGEFRLYEAPEPWGPWTNFYDSAVSDDFGMGPGEGGEFPTKWISSDGLRIYLIFTGNDYFSVRGADLIVD